MDIQIEDHVTALVMEEKSRDSCTIIPGAIPCSSQLSDPNITSAAVGSELVLTLISESRKMELFEYGPSTCLVSIAVPRETQQRHNGCC